ncbi:MAG: aromatic ring-hydroxylating dioxygenase subunit alpha [Alphaproteobacteria bacterium]|nr:aromatic ring-hydroxylating dioxygenase subunit alpha [Alphaproteobacteria bacterium]
MSDPSHLFSPAAFANVRKPLREAETLPTWCYTSPDFHRREIERIFKPAWRLVGREDEFAGAGAFRTIDTFAGPVLVVRGDDGRLRAFLNSCRHRGAQLLDGQGRCGAIVCPYHAWKYGLDGSLLGAPAMDKSLGFDKRGNGLIAARLETWGGFVFVNASRDAPDRRIGPLLEAWGDLPEVLGPYRFGEMVLVRRIDFDVACNWKLLTENAMEEYHTGTVHRVSLGQQQGEAVATRGDWDALFIRQDTTIALMTGETSPFPFVAGLPERHRSGTFFTMIYPSLQLACTQDCMWYLDFQPAGPERTKVTVGFCFPRATVARPDFAAVVERYYARWETSIGEDNAIGEVQQKGMRAEARPPGRLSWKEHHVHKLANWVLDRVLDPPAAGRRAAE